MKGFVIQNETVHDVQPTEYSLDLRENGEKMCDITALRSLYSLDLKMSFRSQQHSFGSSITIINNA